MLTSQGKGMTDCGWLGWWTLKDRKVSTLPFPWPAAKSARQPSFS